MLDVRRLAGAMPLNSLHSAILDGNTGGVRRAVADDPGLLETLSPSGSTPIRLAIDKGRPDIVAALLRAGASTSGVTIDLAQLLCDCVGHVSQSCLCAIWLDSIEYALWEAVCGDTPRTAILDPCLIDQETLSDLRFLSSEVSGWPAWSDGGPVLLPISEWSVLYATWRQTASN